MNVWMCNTKEKYKNQKISFYELVIKSVYLTKTKPKQNFIFKLNNLPKNAVGESKIKQNNS